MLSQMSKHQNPASMHVQVMMAIQSVCTSGKREKIKTVFLPCWETRWACARSALAAKAVQVARCSAHQERSQCASGAEPLVKQTTGVSSCSVAHTVTCSHGRCLSGGRRGPVLRCERGETDTRGRYRRRASHSATSSAFSLWTKCRYLPQAGSPALPICWTGSFLRLQQFDPELDSDSEQGRRTEMLGHFTMLMLKN